MESSGRGPPPADPSNIDRGNEDADIRTHSRTTPRLEGRGPEAGANEVLDPGSYLPVPAPSWSRCWEVVRWITLRRPACQRPEKSVSRELQHQCAEPHFSSSCSAAQASGSRPQSQ